MTKIVRALLASLLLPLLLGGVIYIESSASGKDFTALAQGCWFLNEADVNANDECIGGDDDGTTNGTPGYGTDADFEYGDFATDTWIQIPDAATTRVCDASDACSFGCFINPDTMASFQAIINKGVISSGTIYQIRFAAASPDPMNGTISYTNELGDSDISDAGGWFHTVVTWDDAGDNEVKVYLNGELDCVSCSTRDAASINSAEDLVIGAGQSAAGDNEGDFYHFNGQISQCAVFDYQLTAADVCEWCSTGLDGTDTTRNASLCGGC